MKAMNTSADMTNYFAKTAAEIAALGDNVGASVFTQTTDIEDECDGWLTFDRIEKFDANQTSVARASLQAIIDAHTHKNKAVPPP
jgi:hypothetical protein